MKGDASILVGFETLPELQDKIEQGNARLKAWAIKEVARLTELEPTVREITRSLDAQRDLREQAGITKDIRPIDDARREEYMARELRHAIPFFALRAFSLPKDYRIPKQKIETQTSYEDFIEAIVIQPEYLSDDFLVSLGLMSEEEKDGLPTSQKISKKIQLIPNIKNLLKALAPLKLGGKSTTGRIARVSDEKNPHFGGYIVFQEINEIESDREKKRRSMRRRIIPKFYKDHYSLLRSQRHAKVGLERKLKNLKRIRDDDIPAIILRWQRKDYDDDKKRQDLAVLEKELKGKTGYHERRAREDRIQKIRFQHPEQDKLRLIGACNDMIRAIEEKIGKRNGILGQAEWIRDSERQARSAFERFYEEVIREIPELNALLDGFDPNKVDETENLKGEQTHRLKEFIRIIERYHEELGKIPEIGAPFHRIKGVIESFTKSMKQHRSQRKGAIGKLGVRHILSLILELKKIRYEVMMKEAEYRIKVRGDGMLEHERKNLIRKIEEVRDSLLNQRFLPQIALKSTGQEIFKSMVTELTKVIAHLEEKDMEL
ncbi:MAG: hypothetical protein HHAS10_00570 [Candidatus Altimarinota bacterium]